MKKKLGFGFSFLFASFIRGSRSNPLRRPLIRAPFKLGFFDVFVLAFSFWTRNSTWRQTITS
jgi:hypothetical protein